MADMIHAYRTCRWAPVLALLLSVGAPLESQAPATVVRVQWPLIDVVMVTDSCYGVWLLAAPNVRTSNWERGSQIIGFAVDPLILLQWGTTAQALTRDSVPAAFPDSVRFRATPRLQSRSGGRFMTLVRDLKRGPADRRLQLVLIDSAGQTQWKTFTNAEEVTQLLATIEEVVARAPALRPRTDSSLVADDQESEFEPAVQLKVPRPHYPSALLSRRQPGRVWVEYVVGTDGRVEKGSIHVLLTDHEEFASAAISALQRATFRPATRRGTLVRQRVFQPISFRVSS